MKIAQINSVSGKGSTGKICVGISRVLQYQGIDNRIFYCSGNDTYPNAYKYGDDQYIKLQALRSHLLGNYGFNSKSITRKLIAQLREYRPDIVHLHNIHGHDCDLEMLFTYFKGANTKLVWTFHDCWAFTGYCPYFTMCSCDKWKTGCKDCPQFKKYSWFKDRSHELWNRKKELFSGLDLTIVTPSQWLSTLVKESFLGEYPVKVINNGIDLSVFHPMESDFREKNHCLDKFILLGVSFEWETRKGLDVFLDLAQSLGDSYQIVLVGTNSAIDKRLPDHIISVHKTKNQKELAEIYSTADLLVNPTREENFPTVNIESLACGTPVLTFGTGGSAEIIDSNCGISVACGDTDSLKAQIEFVAAKKPFSAEYCLKRAQRYNMEDQSINYMKLYRNLILEDRRAEYESDICSKFYESPSATVQL